MKIRNLRWWLCGLMFFATALSFLDRQVLSVVAPLVTTEFSMNNEQYSHVTNGFLASYAVMFFFAGRMMDIIGTRRGMLLSVGLWSIASGLHALARNALELGVLRTLLGAGEGGCFPGVTKGAREWFPPQQRALAIGIAIGGAAVGGVLAPPLTVWIVGHIQWRGAFLVTGLIGAAWVGLWYVFYHAPTDSPLLTDEERELIQPQSDASTSPSPSPAIFDLLGRRDVLGLALMRFLFDPVMYFYLFWIPKYLAQERGLSQGDIGRLAWIPFLAMGLSNILGGWTSDRLVSAGIAPGTARKGVMAVAALLTIASSTVASAGTAAAAVAIMSLLMLAHGFWITNYVALISDTIEPGAVATVMGLAGMIGTLGGVAANTGIGWIADHYSFLPIWIASGCMYPLAFMVLLLTVRTPRI